MTTYRYSDAFPPQVKGNPFYEFCWKRTRQADNNVIIFFLGEPGSGKSLTALTAAYDLDRDGQNKPRFSLQNIVFTQKEFKKRVNINRKAGSVIIWEEPYVGALQEGGANARDFMKKKNKQIAGLFGTMRHNNHIIFLTMPLDILFDSQARQMCHGYFIVQENNGKVSFSKFYRRKSNAIMRKEYFKQLTFLYDGFPSKLTSIISYPPPKNLVALYREKADYYKDKWAHEYENDNDQQSQKPSTQKNRFLTDFKENPSRYASHKAPKKHDRYEGFDPHKIAHIQNISLSAARNWLDQALYIRKGNQEQPTKTP